MDLIGIDVTGCGRDGASEDPMVLFVRFRGSEPSVEGLLKKRGLTPVAK